MFTENLYTIYIPSVSKREEAYIYSEFAECLGNVVDIRFIRMKKLRNKRLSHSFDDIERDILSRLCEEDDFEVMMNKATDSNKAAFVRFQPYNNEFVIDVLRQLNTGKGYEYKPLHNKCWMFMKARNKKPIRDEKKITELEKEVAEQKERIADQCVIIQEMQNKMQQESRTLEAVRDTVYQLVGGLFNHQVQERNLTRMINNLYPENKPIKVQSCEDTDETSSHFWCYPTTRQGDNLGKRIAMLEAYRLTELNDAFEEYYDEATDGLLYKEL